MSRFKESLQKRFVCVKCRGRASIVHDVAMPSGPLSRMLPVPTGRYIGLSCSLCGYTDFYNLAAVEHAREPAEAKGELAEDMENA